jgi:hypothetical protein
MEPFTKKVLIEDLKKNFKIETKNKEEAYGQLLSEQKRLLPSLVKTESFTFM